MATTHRSPTHSHVRRDASGVVLSDPASCLTRATAKSIRDCRQLYLGEQGIEVLSGFTPFENLDTLWLNNNRLRSLAGIETLFRLKRLHAHGNSLSVAGVSDVLPRFAFLEELDLSHNSLASLDAVVDCVSHLHYLQQLNLHHNPAAQEVDYRLRVIAALPSLHAFDNHVVTPEERSKAARRYGGGASPGGQRSGRASVARSGASGAGALTLSSLVGSGSSAVLAATRGDGATDATAPQRTRSWRPDSAVEAAVRRDAARARAQRQEEEMRAIEVSFTREVDPAWTAAADGVLTAPLPSALVQTVTARAAAGNVIEHAVARSLAARGVDPHVSLDMAARAGDRGAVTAALCMSLTSAPAMLSATASRPVQLPAASATAGTLRASRGSAAAARDTSKHDIMRQVLARTGIRIGQPPPDAVKARILSRSAAPDAAAAAAASSSAGMPLGEWDRYRVSQVFEGMDHAKSGLMTRAQLRSCVDAAADVGLMALPAGVDDSLVTAAASARSGVSSQGDAPAPAAGGARRASTIMAQSHKALLMAYIDRICDVMDPFRSNDIPWREFLEATTSGTYTTPAAAAPASATAVAAAPTGAATNKSVAASSGGARGAPTGANSKPAGKGVDAVPVLTAVADATAAAAARPRAGGSIVKVPILLWRALTATEASRRAARNAMLSADAFRSSMRLGDAASGSPSAEHAHLMGVAAATAHRATLLADVAETLEGRFDPPEKAPTPPRARSDYLRFTTVVPAREAAKRDARGGRRHRFAYPGDESDSDEEELRGVYAAAEESEDEEQAMTARLRGVDEGAQLRHREAAQALAARLDATLRHPAWTQHRAARKARKPHVVMATTMAI